MVPTRDEINKMTGKLVDYLLDSKSEQARQLATRLSELLGLPTDESISTFTHAWIAIFEARGDLSEASRIQGRDIARTRVEIESGDYDRFPELLPGEITYLQHSLYFQAERYHRLDDRDSAIECLVEIFDLGKRHGIVPSEDVEALYCKLMALSEE